MTVSERANFVAYLDGELDATECETIASRLTANPVARREVEQLQQTWELLDFLPRPQVPEDFTHRTLAEIQSLGGAGEWVRQFRHISARITRVLVAVLACSVLLLLGYAFTRWALPDPTARLEQDLSLAEHLDDYRAVGSFEFLKRIDDLSQTELEKLGSGAGK